MIGRIELQQEIYKIISKSITEEERQILELKEEQIIPTISLFRNIKWELISIYMMYDFNDSCIWGNIPFQMIKNKEKINVPFLQLLCQKENIELSSDQEEIKFWRNVSLIESDIESQYHL